MMRHISTSRMAMAIMALCVTVVAAGRELAAQRPASDIVNSARAMGPAER